MQIYIFAPATFCQEMQVYRRVSFPLPLVITPMVRRGLLLGDDNCEQQGERDRQFARARAHCVVGRIQTDHVEKKIYYNGAISFILNNTLAMIVPRFCRWCSHE